MPVIRGKVGKEEAGTGCFLIIGGTRDEAFGVQHGVVNGSLKAAALLHGSALARASAPFANDSVCVGIGAMPAMLCRSRIHADRRSAPAGHRGETALDFSRAAGARAGGTISIDAGTGARHVARLTNLGGFAIMGSVRLTGEPFRHVRVSLLPSA